MRYRSILTFTIPTLACAAALTAAVWGKKQEARAEEYSRLADEYITVTVNSCGRCSRELSECVDEMNVSLSKLSVTASKEGQVLALEDIVRESGEAASLLSRIPGEHAAAAELQKFLTCSGDYARTLSKKLLCGDTLTPDDAEQLEAMLHACAALDERLCGEIANGSIPMGTEEFGFYEESESAGEEPSEPEYPVLVYDGPFSDSAEKLEPLGISGEERTAEEARELAESICGTALTYCGRSEGLIPTYDFTDGETDISLTVRGLNVLSLMRAPSGNRSGMPEGAELEAFEKRAGELLRSVGYPNMAPTFSEFCDGEALILCAYSEGGVMFYGDTVKLRLDRETGELIGIDARDYLFSHHERELTAPAITAEEAKRSVSSRLGISSVRLAMIPLTPQTEALCYEFRGTSGEEEYLVYVNAYSGREEMIFKLINDGNGIKAV